MEKSLLDRLQKIASQTNSDSQNLVEHYKNEQGLKEQEKEALKLVERRAKIAALVLEDVLSTYKTQNAWTPISFGANADGIHRATVDDFMHYFESGLGMYVGKVAFLGLTKSERKKVEAITSNLFHNLRSGVLSTYPRGRFHSGFSNMTLLTASEKIGMLFSLHIVLRTEKGKEVFETAMKRQQHKYMSFPVAEGLKKKQAEPKLSDYPLRTDKHLHRDKNRAHPFPRDEASARAVVAHIKSHSLHFLLDLDLDEMQLGLFLSGIWAVTRTIKKDEHALINVLPFLEDKGVGLKSTPPVYILEQYIFERMLPPAPKRNGSLEFEDEHQLLIEDVLDSEDLPVDTRRRLVSATAKNKRN